MTKEQFEEAEKIKYKMQKISEKIDAVNEFLDRTNRTIGPYQETIKIKLAEQYVATPEVEVRVYALIEFITLEGLNLISENEELREKFKEL